MTDPNGTSAMHRLRLRSVLSAMGEQSQPVSVLVADALALFREGLVSLCEGWAYEVAGQCADGETAYDLIRKLRPDAAILDLCLPRLDTLELVRRVRASELGTKLLVMSLREDRKTVIETLRSGAHAYLLKSGPALHLHEAIRLTLEGGVYVSPSLEAERLFGQGREKSLEDPLESLSTREYQVFRLLVDGLRAKEIAGRLDLSAKTIDTYRSNLMRKLDIHDLAGLVKYAVQRNLTPTE